MIPNPTIVNSDAQEALRGIEQATVRRLKLPAICDLCNGVGTRGQMLACLSVLDGHAAFRYRCRHCQQAVSSSGLSASDYLRRRDRARQVIREKRAQIYLEQAEREEEARQVAKRLLRREAGHRFVARTGECLGWFVVGFVPVMTLAQAFQPGFLRSFLMVTGVGLGLLLAAIFPAMNNSRPRRGERE